MPASSYALYASCRNTHTAWHKPPTPPPPRDIEIYRQNRLEHLSTRRLAEDYQLSQTRIRQILERVNQWLIAVLPPCSDTERARQAYLAQHLAADRLQRQIEKLEIFWDNTYEVRYLRAQAQLILMIARLGVVPGTLESLLADGMLGEGAAALSDESSEGDAPAEEEPQADHAMTDAETPPPSAWNQAEEDGLDEADNEPGGPGVPDTAAPQDGGLPPVGAETAGSEVQEENWGESEADDPVEQEPPTPGSTLERNTGFPTEADAASAAGLPPCSPPPVEPAGPERVRAAVANRHANVSRFQQKAYEVCSAAAHAEDPLRRRLDPTLHTPCAPAASQPAALRHPPGALR